MPEHCPRRARGPERGWTRPRAGQASALANIMHFARTCAPPACRSGRARCCAPIEAVEAAGLRKRDDFYWTLHSVFVNRRDQREIFDQAFHVFWRNPRLLEKMMEMLLPQVGVPADPDAEQAAQPPPAGGAAARPRRGAEGRGRAARSRDRGDLHLLRPRGAAAHGLRADVAGRDRRGAARHRAAAPAGAAAAHPPLPAGAPRPAGRLPRLAAPRAAAGRPDRAAQARAAPPAAAARHPVRHLRLDEPATRACSCISCTRSPTTATASTASPSARGSPTSPARCATGTSTSRCRRRRPQVEDWSGGTRIGQTPARVQQQVVAPRAGPGRRRAADHRRARPRGRRRAWPRRWSGCTSPAAG